MIKTHGPGYTLLHHFLGVKEKEQLQELASQMEDWSQGCQEGGYFKADLTGLIQEGWLRMVIQRARQALGTGYQVKSDAWLLYFPPNTYVPWHRDPAPRGKKHIRLNAVVTNPWKGGEFEIINERPLSSDIHQVPLPEGSAVIFSPSLIEHRVTEIPDNDSRLVFSVGALIDG